MQWRSRRGLLELDLLLEPFARHRLPALDEAQRDCYEQLLAAEDPQLLEWFRNGAAPSPQLGEMVRLVLEYGRR